MTRYTEAQLRAYRALSHAADQIGAEQFRRGNYRVKRRRGKVIQGYQITEAHRRVVQAMPDVLKGTITVEEAMAVIYEYDVTEQRFRP